MCSERHERVSEIENPSLVAALLALKTTPSEQRGDLANLISCQVFFAFFKYISRAVWVLAASRKKTRVSKLQLD
ncbi:hypothetical protein NTGBS_970010 [Candidatus Nitrotoga sp. BS]|nr:hypothetical protein NTGBS_970010 [Candidatus Nitrotoga sp. BS]